MDAIDIDMRLGLKVEMHWIERIGNHDCGQDQWCIHIVSVGEAWQLVMMFSPDSRCCLSSFHDGSVA